MLHEARTDSRILQCQPAREPVDRPVLRHHGLGDARGHGSQPPVGRQHAHPDRERSGRRNRRCARVRARLRAPARPRWLDDHHFGPARPRHATARRLSMGASGRNWMDNRTLSSRMDRHGALPHGARQSRAGSSETRVSSGCAEPVAEMAVRLAAVDGAAHRQALIAAGTGQPFDRTGQRQAAPAGGRRSCPAWSARDPLFSGDAGARREVPGHLSAPVLNIRVRR